MEPSDQTNSGKVDEARRLLVHTGHELFRSGMAPGTSGNLSALVPGTKTALVKKTGVCLGDAVPEDFLLVDLQGNVLDGDGRPSKECAFHVGIYRVRPDVGAVVHAHPPYATAFSLTCESLPLLTLPARMYLGQVPRVAALPPGSAELAQSVVERLSDSSLKALLMEAHGVVVVGTDVLKALHLTQLLENAAQVAYVSTTLSSLGVRRCQA